MGKRNKEVEYFDDQDLDLACRDWLRSNYKTLGDIDEAIKFFVDLGEDWKNELDLLLEHQSQKEEVVAKPTRRRTQMSSMQPSRL